MKKLLTMFMVLIMTVAFVPAMSYAGVSEDGSAYVLEENETWSDKSFSGDVYIPQKYTLTTTGNTVIDGDVYVFGTFDNEGGLTISGNLNCLNYLVSGEERSVDGYSYGIFKSETTPADMMLNVSDSYLNTSVPAVHHHNYQTITVKPTVTADGSITVKCMGCGDVKSQQVIYRPAVYSLSQTNMTYTGKNLVPSVTIRDRNNNTLKNNVDYSLAYSSNKAIGKASIKVTFKNKYSGVKSLNFNINPKGTSLSKVSAGKNAFTAKWKKQKTQTSGYQIRYSVNSNFSGSKIVTVSGTKATSKTVKKLQAKKKYYVAVRTYKTVKGTKYYSGWSKAKGVTTKGTVKKSTAKKSNTTAVSSSKTVYITQTGTKYHYTKNCRGLSNANKIIPTTLSKAKSGGYTLCGYED